MKSFRQFVNEAAAAKSDGGDDDDDLKKITQYTASTGGAAAGGAAGGALGSFFGPAGTAIGAATGAAAGAVKADKLAGQAYDAVKPKVQAAAGEVERYGERLAGGVKKHGLVGSAVRGVKRLFSS